ncbi:MAG: hypothetical protein KBA66_09725 [Leptospiraceae bacterium]|nr:hypothetical protein [Leptospiraceae bacterium]
MNLKQEIKTALEKNLSLPELKSILLCFKENGGTREKAHLNLYELLQYASTEEEDAKLRELIDFAIGYSGKITSIWS